MIKFKEFIENIRQHLLITKLELTIICIVLIGLLIGITIKKLDPKLIERKNAIEVLYKQIDSLDNILDTNSLVIENDSIIEVQESNFPKYKPKELPKKPININKATLHELMKLPGVGNKMAETIINYRKESNFNAKEDLMKVKGIGKKKYEKLKDYIVIQ
jgi:comEA protein